MSDFKQKKGGMFESEPGLVIEGAEGFFEVSDQIEDTKKPVKVYQPSPEAAGGDSISTNEDSEFINDRDKAPATDSPEGAGRPRIGDRLVSMGIISKDQLNVALQEKKISGKLLGEVLVDLGFITADTLATFLAETSGFDVFDAKQTLLDASALALIDKATAQRHNVLPVSMDGNFLRVAMADPYDVVAIDTLRRYLPKGVTIKPLLVTPVALNDAIDTAYGYASSINGILKEIENEGEENLDVVGLSEEKAYAHPIVRLVNALIFEAVKLDASDLHFEPEENFVRLRYRVDGVLFTAQILHRQHWNAISQRLKIMSSLNIADKLTPQDGRIQMNAGGRMVDFRVSSLPTVFGENIVLRVLDRQTGIATLTTLGFSTHNMSCIKTAQARPEGIIIVTGPTGSGKTTSLYSMLNEINSVDVNIQTLEDPVEYSLPMIRQTAVREGILEFPEGIRAMLRQDPDIIFIGEIRDNITAQMALQAAMTGHQVYTTLHTNDAFGVMPRLFDLGLVPGMVAGNIVAVMAQRLARTLCPHCKVAHEPTPEERTLIGAELMGAEKIYEARQGGCDHCGGQGYKGRVPVAEVLVMDDDLDEIIARGGTRVELKDTAIRKGFKSMRQDGMLKVAEGLISLEALAKIVALHR
jgi:general secretion pathway protein E/type IV pilus assembly protein PilB